MIFKTVEDTEKVKDKTVTHTHIKFFKDLI